jgi:hypothetical protein
VFPSMAVMGFFSFMAEALISEGIAARTMRMQM